MAKYQNSLIASPYLSFGVEELYKRLSPNYLIFNLRNPVKSVESFYRKGWYLDNENVSFKSPAINISENLKRTFSRIVPHNDFFKDWLQLTRIGKLAWFWCTINKAIYDEFEKINNTDKIYIRLEDVDQNYEIYEELFNKFKFKKKLNTNQFLNVINKAPNKGPQDKYQYKDWNNLEKEQFDTMIKNLFPYYDKIRTKI